MDKRIFSTAALFTALAIMPLAYADSPPNITTLDSHSAEAKGKITLYRVQVQGMEFGAAKKQSDAEVLVTLDSTPDNVYVLRLHQDSPPVTSVMANTLRDAFVSKTNVTLYYQKVPDAPNTKNFKINVVQLNK